MSVTRARPRTASLCPTNVFKGLLCLQSLTVLSAEPLFPISVRRGQATQQILTGDELFPINCHNSQNRLGVTFQIVRQLEVLPHLGGAVELALSNLNHPSGLMTYLSHDPEIMVPSEAACSAQTLFS